MLPVLLAIALVASAASAQSSEPLIKEARLEVTSVEDSGSYLLYRYRLVNSPLSRAAIAVFNLDLSAPPGTGLTMLPSTGKARHLAEIAVGKVTDHVPVGIIMPEGWSAALMPNAILANATAEGYVAEENGRAVTFTRDSAPPGGARTGFGLRSPYLPGLRRFSAEPTLGSCCDRVKPGSGEYPVQGAFRARGTTVAPTVAPESITVEVVRRDLEQICGELGWVSDTALCGRLEASLRSDVTTFLRDLENQRSRGGILNDNAYWLLKVNAHYLAAHR